MYILQACAKNTTIYYLQLLDKLSIFGIFNTFFNLV